MWPFIWKVLDWILRIWCMLEISVYFYLVVCFGAYVWSENMSARGGCCVRALFNTCVHMSVCVRVRVSLSACVLLFSLFLSSSVVFEMIRGNSMSVCGCLDGCGPWYRDPKTPPGGLCIAAPARRATFILFTAFSFFSGFFLSLYSPPSGSYVPGYGLSLDQFLSLTFLFEKVQSWNFQGT